MKLHISQILSVQLNVHGNVRNMNVSTRTYVFLYIYTHLTNLRCPAWWIFANTDTIHTTWIRHSPFLAPQKTAHSPAQSLSDVQRQTTPTLISITIDQLVLLVLELHIHGITQHTRSLRLASFTHHSWVICVAACSGNLLPFSFLLISIPCLNSPSSTQAAQGTLLPRALRFHSVILAVFRHQWADKRRDCGDVMLSPTVTG